MPRRSKQPDALTEALKDVDLSYDAQRQVWARSLSDEEVRSLASDFLRGYIDECNADAHAEYERRFGDNKKSQASNKTKKSAKRSSSRYK